MLWQYFLVKKNMPIKHLGREKKSRREERKSVARIFSPVLFNPPVCVCVYMCVRAQELFCISEPFSESLFMSEHKDMR